MAVLFYIFMVLASLDCLATLGYVGYEIYREVQGRRASKEPPVSEEETVDEPVQEAVAEDQTVPEELLQVEEDESGVVIVEVTWREDMGKNKTYRYAVNEFDLCEGDIVLVPTFDAQRRVEVARKVAVTSQPYRVDPTMLPFRLKPVLRIVQKAV